MAVFVYRTARTAVPLARTWIRSYSEQVAGPRGTIYCKISQFRKGELEVRKQELIATSLVERSGPRQNQLCPLVHHW